MVATEFRAEAVEEAVVTDEVAIDPRSPVDWGAILAGAVIGAAISVILLSFGGAVGLSTTSPFRGEGMGLTGLAVATAIWVVIAQAVSFGAGGYIAGRMRRRGAVATREAEIRDSAHGLVAWAVAALATVLIGALIAAGAAMKTADVATGTAAGAAAGGVAAGVASTDRAQRPSEPTDYYVDQLFRTEGEVPPAAETEAARAETGRILARGALLGDVPAEDRAHVARMVAARTGLAEADARARLDQVLLRAQEAAERAEQTARRAAEAARRGAIVLGFLSAASLLAGAAAAAFGARCGGRDRDQGTAYRYLIRG